MNMYAYAGNDPINARDPSGLFCFASRLASCAQQLTQDGGGGSGLGDTSNAHGSGPNNGGAGGGGDEIIVVGLRLPRFSSTGLLSFFASNGISNRGITPIDEIVVTSRRSEDQFYTPVPDSFRAMYYGFAPGDFCYQNLECSGRTIDQSWLIELPISVVGAWRRLLANTARNAAPTVGRYLTTSNLFGKYGILFGRGGKLQGGFFNRTYIRVGYGWSGSGQTGSDVIRFAIGPSDDPIVKFTLYTFKSRIPGR